MFTTPESRLINSPNSVNYCLSEFYYFCRFRFLYCSEINLEEKHAINISAAAKRFEIQDLVELCVDFYKRGIDETNVLQRLKIAVQYDMKDLVDSCMNYINKNMKLVTSSPAFLTLDNHVMSKIVGTEDLNISEIELFESVVKWAKHQLSASGTSDTPTNVRNVIGDIIFQIRFPTMTMDEFSHKVVPSGILSCEETAEVFQVLTIPGTTLNIVTFPTGNRNKSKVFQLEIFKDYEIVNSPLNMSPSHISTMSLTLRTESLLTINSFTFALSIQTPVVSSIYGTLTVNQNAVNIFSQAVNCSVDATKPAVQFQNQSFSLGTFPCSIKLKRGFFTVMFQYCCYNPTCNQIYDPMTGGYTNYCNYATTGLHGKQQNDNSRNNISSGILICCVQKGPLHSIEFAP